MAHSLFACLRPKQKKKCKEETILHFTHLNRLHLIHNQLKLPLFVIQLGTVLRHIVLGAFRCFVQVRPQKEHFYFQNIIRERRTLDLAPRSYFC